MITKYKYNEQTWVDIDHGTPEEIHQIMDSYNVHPMVAKELTSATLKPRVEFHDGYAYCILHFPAFKHTHSEKKNQEVDFIIGKNILITAKYDTIDALEKFSKTLEVNEVLENRREIREGTTVFGQMLRELYSSIFDELEYIEDMTEEITKKIFAGKEKEMVVSISEVMRTLLDFKKVTDLHYEILESLRTHGKQVFGDDFSKEIEKIVLDYLKINTTIKSNLDTLRELRDTNNSLLTSKQNETVKQLTVVSFIILPLNLIAFIFAMRTEGMPVVNNPNAFWMIITLMATTALVVLTYVRYKKWM